MGWGVFVGRGLCLRSSLHLIVSELGQTEHAAVGCIIRAGLCKIIEKRAGRLDDVVRDKRRPFGRSLLCALDAPFPFQDRPAVETPLRSPPKDSGELHLPT